MYIRAPDGGYMKRMNPQTNGRILYIKIIIRYKI